MSRENTVGRLIFRQGLTVCVLFHLQLISAQTLRGEWCDGLGSCPLTKKWGEGSGKEECVRLLMGESKRVKESSPSQGCWRPHLSERSRAVCPAYCLRWEGAQVQVWLLGSCLWVCLGPSVGAPSLASAWPAGALARVGRRPSAPMLGRGSKNRAQTCLPANHRVCFVSVYLTWRAEESLENCPRCEDGW